MRRLWAPLDHGRPNSAPKGGQDLDTSAARVTGAREGTVLRPKNGQLGEIAFSVDRPLPTPPVVVPNAEDEAAASRPAGLCDATVRLVRYGEFTCEKDAGHEGPHEASTTGRWQRVVWH